MPAAEPTFAILASGRGSNAAALMDAFRGGNIPARLALVVSNEPAAPVLLEARRRDYEAVVVPHRGITRDAHEQAVLAELTARGVQHLLLAGYMRVLSPAFVRQWPGAILNIHPSLLPEFRGLDAVRRQWDAGRRVVGATVHRVDSGVDTGPILLQGSIDASECRSAEELGERLRHEVEHIIYPRAVRLFLERQAYSVSPSACEAAPATSQPALGQVRRALFSVSDKTGLAELARHLVARGATLLASGGTARHLREHGIAHTTVERYTGTPELLDGRVKTLHPRVHAAILVDRRRPEHLHDLAVHGIAPIDLVVCNLYPFAQSLAAGAADDGVIENIDIGGPTLLRAAAKNAEGGVTVLADPGDYQTFLEQTSDELTVPEHLRRRFAAKAFACVSEYDRAISAWALARAGVAEPSPSTPRLPGTFGPLHITATLRYGENPHQAAALYAAHDDSAGLAQGELLCGKELSYNNYLDLDAAARAAAMFAEPACAIIKHTNPCGLALGADSRRAFESALAGDPLSAFGGVIGLNRALDEATAAAIIEHKLFVECIVAPSFDATARALLQRRVDLRLFRLPEPAGIPRLSGHFIRGAVLLQEVDTVAVSPETWRCVTNRAPDADTLGELGFALRGAALLKSNAIAITRSRQLVGAGSGQASRVDAVRHAVDKAGARAHGACMASDAFFPFPDSIQHAAKAGIRAIVQPGGSKRDGEVIAACNDTGIAMLFCGQRHFRH